MTAAKKSRRKASPVQPEKFSLPTREWERMTELVKLFVYTGWLKNARAQSMLLISEPGSGKSELLDRFILNGTLEYASDLTVQGLYPILKRMRQGTITHIFATEFQKFFLRKTSTAENTLGTLCQMMEEGVRQVMVGGKVTDFGGAQGGLIGAITHQTAEKWKRPLHEYGFWSRCAAFDWDMSHDELRGVMASISSGNRADLEPIIVKAPREKVHIEFPVALSTQFEEFVVRRMMQHTVLRVFQRFRALAMAAALMDGRDIVHARDVEKVVSFDVYWSRMVKG